MHYLDPVSEATLIRFDQDRRDRRLNLLRQLSIQEGDVKGTASILTRFMALFGDFGGRLRGSDRPGESTPVILDRRSRELDAQREDLAA